MADDQERNEGAELQRHRAAIDVLDRCLAHVLVRIEAGMTEKQLASMVELYLVEHAEGPSILPAPVSLRHPLAVAYLGPAGTYSHAAVTRHFGDSIVTEPCASIDEVFRAAEGGRTDYAVVPVENSTEGAVGRTLDLMCQTPLTIVGEIKLRIVQNLLAKDVALDAVTRVYSHAQSLAQCVQWLARHLPSAARVAVASNAEAARLAAGESGAAAIAGEAAAAIYGLDIVAALAQGPGQR